MPWIRHCSRLQPHLCVSITADLVCEIRLHQAALGRVLEIVPNGRAILSRQNHAISVPAAMSTAAGTRRLSHTLRRTTVQHALGRRTPGVARHRLERHYLRLRPRPRPSNPSHHGDKRHIPDSLLCVSKNFFAFMVHSLHLIVGALPGLSHASLATCHHRTSLWTVLEQHNYSPPIYINAHSPKFCSMPFKFFFLFAHPQTFVACHSAVFDPYIYVSHPNLRCPLPSRRFKLSSLVSKWFGESLVLYLIESVQPLRLAR